MMSEKIRSHTKVVLQGDGGDELFGGYRRYATLTVHSLPVAANSWRDLCKSLHRLAPPKSPLHYRIQRYMHALSAPDLATTMALLLTQEDRFSHPSNVFAPGMADAIGKFDPFARFREVQPWFADLDVAHQMSLTDIYIELPDLFLEKVDRSTMAASLEVRVPFLDHDLVDYALGLSGGRKMPFGRKKWLLKRALHGVVPVEVLRQAQGRIHSSLRNMAPNQPKGDVFRLFIGVYALASGDIEPRPHRDTICPNRRRTAKSFLFAVEDIEFHNLGEPIQHAIHRSKRQLDVLCAPFVVSPDRMPNGPIDFAKRRRGRAAVPFRASFSRFARYSEVAGVAEP